jgi:septal ring factor EnvC (AmiA/AmiB activator)
MSFLLAVDPGALAQGEPGRMESPAPLQGQRGQLPRPSQGDQLIDFGQPTQYGTLSKGIIIQARPAAMVIAPSDGWVLFAGKIEGQIDTVIIDAGGGYHFVLGGFGEVDVKVGQFVLSGEPIGVLPRAANAQSAHPVLYIELRKDGQSIDPGPWWRKN